MSRCPWCQAGVAPGATAPRPAGQYCAAHAAPPRNPEPSPRQADVVAAVRELTAAGEPASASAIARRLGISRQLASRQLGALERKGILADVPKVVRSGTWAEVKRSNETPERAARVAARVAAALESPDEPL